MRRPTFVPAVLAAICLLGTSGARAQDIVYGPDGAPTVVQRKLHSMTGRWEAGASFAIALNNALIDQVGGLERMGFSFSAFVHYAAIVSAGPAHPDYLKAIDAAASAAERLRDDVVAPNLFEKVYGEPLSALAPQRLARIRASLALLGYRAGRYERAARLAEQVPPGTEAYPQAQYVTGLLQERTDPQNAAATFRALAVLPGAEGELKELAWMALGRTLYALHLYAEASAAIGSPLWSQAAFERLGEAYRNFNKGLLDAPMPRGLDAEQRELYRSTLESQALPLEDKATAAFADAIRVSQKSGVYTEWVIKAQDFLREYQPVRYVF